MFCKHSLQSASALANQYQVEAKLALKAASIESQYSREAKAEQACGYLRDSI